MIELERKLEEVLEFDLYKERDDVTGAVKSLHPIVESKAYDIVIDRNAKEDQYFDTRYQGEHPKLDIEYSGWTASLISCKYNNEYDCYYLRYHVQGYARIN